ncbi:hypothetical protein CR513_62987, partial [Mucuna pruriens]
MPRLVTAAVWHHCSFLSDITGRLSYALRQSNAAQGSRICKTFGCIISDDKSWKRGGVGLLRLVLATTRGSAERAMGEEDEKRKGKMQPRLLTQIHMSKLFICKICCHNLNCDAGWSRPKPSRPGRSRHRRFGLGNARKPFGKAGLKSGMFDLIGVCPLGLRTSALEDSKST